jgi:hypothetical protein
VVIRIALMKVWIAGVPVYKVCLQSHHLACGKRQENH